MAGEDLVRQSSSSTCSSQHSQRFNSVMKTQLNFFMTRLLFMQERQADSLGARATNARRMNASLNSSGNFNNSASSRLDHPKAHDSSELLNYFDEPDDICVFNDNAKILPNSRAKSMPPVPFPPAAPESPRQVEGKDGLLFKLATHRHADLNRKPAAVRLPYLPMDNMTLEEEEEEEQVEEVVMEEDEEEQVETEDQAKRASRKSWSAPNVPADQRVFPKNQRRSKRDSFQRSKSLGRKSEGGTSDEEQPNGTMNSSSCH